MKLLVILLFISCTSSIEKKSNWKSTEVFLNPESAYYEKKSNVVFVSNVEGEGAAKDGKGYISKLSPMDGKTLKKKWVSGLNAPKGMGAYYGNLYVSDIDRVLVIEISSGTIIKEISIPNAKFLNDIAITPEGVVYVSDTIGSSIYKIKNYESSLFVKGPHLESPNGLLYLSGRLYVAAWGLTTDWSTKIPGKLYWIDRESKSITNITKNPLGNLDGLELDKNGDFLVSDWVAGKVFKVSREGQSSILFEGKKGLADIGYLPTQNLILIPGMLENNVFTVENR